MRKAVHAVCARLVLEQPVGMVRYQEVIGAWHERDVFVRSSAMVSEGSSEADWKNMAEVTTNGPWVCGLGEVCVETGADLVHRAGAAPLCGVVKVPVGDASSGSFCEAGVPRLH